MDEDEVVTEEELASLIYPQLGLCEGLRAIFKEKLDSRRKREFWSDPCWSE